MEAHNFDIRKNLLEYDNVANEQRKAVYGLRDQIMGADRVTSLVDDIRPDVVAAVADAYIPAQAPEDQWNIQGLHEALKRDFNLDLPLKQWLDDPAITDKGFRERIGEALRQAYENKKIQVGAAVLEHFEKAVMLQVLDGLWREHLAAMDYLRQGIHLRGYAQKDPKQEYKREAFSMFNDVLARYKHEVTALLARVRIQTEAEVQRMEEERRQEAKAKEARMRMQHAEMPGSETAVPVESSAAPATPAKRFEPPARPAKVATVTRDQPKVGRNDPCPCGSGKKYKQCHGALV